MIPEGFVYSHSEGCPSCAGSGRVASNAATTFVTTHACSRCGGGGVIHLYRVRPERAS